MQSALKVLKIAYENGIDKPGNFTFVYEGQRYHLQIIDRNEAGIAYPRNFIEFTEYSFNENQYVSIQSNRNNVGIPCVPKEFFSHSKDGGFCYKNSTKNKGILLDVNVSAFDISDFEINNNNKEHIEK